MLAHDASEAVTTLPAIDGITVSLRQMSAEESNRDLKWWVTLARHGVYNFTQRACPCLGR